MNRLMTRPARPLVAPHRSAAEQRRRAFLFALLEEIFIDLDPTAMEGERVKRSYNAVGEWLAGSDHPLLVDCHVSPHGSWALGTAVRPIGDKDMDIDLIGLCGCVGPENDPALIKKVVGDRLAENETYRKMLIEKKRCWRLDYAGQFHLDLSPTIPNPACSRRGELVPDRALQDWHPTNPKGYRDLFVRRAALMPRMADSLIISLSKDARVEPLEISYGDKGVLRRLVQLVKRHRDIRFENDAADVAPISIILTTLAARAYEQVVGHRIFTDELDVLIEAARLMPAMIDESPVNGRGQWAVWNETTQGENFADRWNAEPGRATAFFEWHKRLVSDLERLQQLIGRDAIDRALREMFGEAVVQRVFKRRTEAVLSAHGNGLLGVAPGLGLVTGVTPLVTAATPVPRNEFHGEGVSETLCI